MAKDTWPYTDYKVKAMPAWKKAKTDPKRNPDWPFPEPHYPEVIRVSPVPKQVCMVYNAFRDAEEWLPHRIIRDRSGATADAGRTALFKLTEHGLLEPHADNARFKHRVEYQWHLWRRKDEGELTPEQQTLVERIASATRIYGAAGML